MSGGKLEIVECVPLTEKVSVALVSESGTNFSIYRADRNCKVGLFATAVCYIIHARNIQLCADKYGVVKIRVDADHIIVNDSTELRCSYAEGYIVIKSIRE